MGDNLVDVNSSRIYGKRSPSGDSAESSERTREQLDPALTREKYISSEQGKQRVGGEERLDPALTQEKYQAPMLLTGYAQHLAGLIKDENAGKEQKLHTSRIVGGEDVRLDSNIIPASTPNTTVSQGKANGKDNTSGRG